jgi:hypothetical protein
MSNTALNKILFNTTIKRACCINKGKNTAQNYQIPVRIPYFTGYTYGSDPASLKAKQYDYIDKLVTVPASLCNSLDNENGTWENGSNVCNSFMKLYCYNVRNDYESKVKEQGGTTSLDEFNLFKPECACYGQKPESLPDDSGFNIPVSCYNDYCNASSSSYMDTAAKEPCQMNIVQCNAINNYNKISAGEKIQIAPKISQQCGFNKQQIPSADNAVPSADNAVPSADNAVPSADNAVPSADNAVPSADNAVPSADNAVPSVDNAVPSGDIIVPSSDNKTYLIIGSIICCCVIIIILIILMIL